MKHAIAIVFCALLLAVSFFTGCAGPATQIKDNGVKVEAEGGIKVPGAAETLAEKAPVDEKKGEAGDGVKAAGAAEKPTEKVYVDKKGKFEISSTPFGYVKREKKQAEAEKELSAPGQQGPVVPLTPEVKAPAAPPALRTEPASPAPGPSGQISFDFDDADLYAVIRTMADMLKINYIIDPTVSGKVTIHTAGRLRDEDLFPIFHQTLEVNGLAAVKEGNVYRILKLKDVLRMPIASRLVREAKDIPPEERIVIQIIPLKFISAQEITKVITPFISADGTIISEGGSNTLLVVDKGINIFKVLKLVEVFDVSVFEKLNYRFYTLENINAEEAVKLLREVLSLSAGGSKDDVKFIPINRLNTLLIVSPTPDVFGRVDAFIRQLDIPSEGAQPNIYIYSVKNGMATELGDILRSIFGKGGEIKKSAGKESVPTNPFAKGYTERKTTATPSATPTATATPSVTPTASVTSTAPATPAAPAATETGPSLTLRGDIRITADPIRNALIIEAIPGDYQIVERILGRLDVLPRQVLIEVVIAEISLSKGTELGIEWNFKKDNWTDTGLLSASIGASGLQYAIGLSQKWQIALHALARDSKVNILSSPSVLASDNKQARIDVTTEVPIPSTSYTIQTTGPNVLETKVEYRNTGVILDVTPHINEHGLVTMDVSQEVSSVGELVKVAGQDYYTFNKRKVVTALTVKHNQAIVIGGLISDQKNDAATGLPWLVKIPLIRWLFGVETKSVSKSELIVMITPRVITSLEDVDAVSEEFKKKVGNAMTAFR
jgi:general secretion pathway protein D